jgi:hypothetical protein
MDCPKCGFAASDGAEECSRCGIVFSRWQDVLPASRMSRRPAAVDDGDQVVDGHVGRKELVIMGPGLAAAILMYAMPPTHFLFCGLITLFHELGHTIVGWLLGHPSLPAFDFVYGGGFTHLGEFHAAIAVLIGAGFAWAGWTFRRNRKTMVLIAVVAAIWLFFVTAEWRRELAIAVAGHGFEFILAGIFFYMALSGRGWRIPELERPVGAFVAFYVEINAMFFALRLRSDPEFLDWYREGKGGALMNDLEVVALDLQIYLGVHPGIRGVAGMLIAFSFVPIAVALVWYFYRKRSHRFVQSLLQTEA